MAEQPARRLVDTSAWVAADRNAAVGESFRGALKSDLVATCSQVDLELLFTARNAADYEQRAADLALLPHAPCGELVFARALEVQRLLAHKGGLYHRSVSIPDLVIAAAAELAGLPVWHYDSDFDRIAAVTGQPTIWIARRGSLR